MVDPDSGPVLEPQNIDLHRYTVIDVREPHEYSAGHLKESINIPLAELESAAGDIDSLKPVLLICKAGIRSEKGCLALRSRGVNCYSLSGGLTELNKYVDEPINVV